MNKHSQRAVDALIGGLVSMYPDDPLVAEEKKQLQIRNPELASRIGAYTPNQSLFQNIEPLRDESPFTPDELLKVPPAKRIREILDFKNTGWGQPNRDGLINAICSAADRNADWAFDFLAALLLQNERDNDLWHRLLWKLKWEKMSVSQRNWLLDSFDPTYKYDDDFLRGFAHLVLSSGFPLSDEPPDSQILEKQLKLTFHLWMRTSADPGWKVETPYSETDWIFEAINRPPGQCCVFWLKYTELLQKSNPEAERVWPSSIEPRMNEIVRAETRGQLLGLALLGQYLASVRYLAPKWTKEKLYPCFDFEKRGDLAYPPWLGFSGYGRLSRELAAELPPYFKTAFSRINQFKDTLAERFTGLVAAIAISGDADVKQDDWLKEFHASVNEKLARKWLSNLSRLLRGFLPEDKKKVWNEWLRDYWQDRADGIPHAITPSETHSFYKLALALGPLAHEALPLIQRLPKTEADWSHVFLDLDKSTLFDEDPVALVEIIAWWLGQTRNIVAGPKELNEFVGRLPKSAKLLPGLRKIQDELLRVQPTYADILEKAVFEKFGK